MNIFTQHTKKTVIKNTYLASSVSALYFPYLRIIIMVSKGRNQSTNPPYNVETTGDHSSKEFLALRPHLL